MLNPKEILTSTQIHKNILYHVKLDSRTNNQELYNEKYMKKFCIVIGNLGKRNFILFLFRDGESMLDYIKGTKLINRA